MLSMPLRVAAGHFYGIAVRRQSGFQEDLKFSTAVYRGGVEAVYEGEIGCKIIRRRIRYLYDSHDQERRQLGHCSPLQRARATRWKPQCLALVEHLIFVSPTFFLLCPYESSPPIGHQITTTQRHHAHNTRVFGSAASGDDRPDDAWWRWNQVDVRLSLTYRR